MEYRPVWLYKVKAERVHLCRVAGRLTLCDPIWQVTFRSYEMTDDRHAADILQDVLWGSGRQCGLIM